MTNAAVSACSRESALLKSVLQAAVWAAHLLSVSPSKILPSHFYPLVVSLLASRQAFAIRFAIVSRKSSPVLVISQHFVTGVQQMTTIHSFEKFLRNY